MSEPADFDTFSDDCYLEDDEEQRCPHCGKPYEDFSDVGCGFCDQRSPEWGMV